VGPLPFQPFDAANSFAAWLLLTSFCVRRTPRLGRGASVVSAASLCPLLLSLLEEDEEEDIPEGGGLSGGGGADRLRDGDGDGGAEGCCYWLWRAKI
jgi:hypothetical protein